MQVAAFDIQKIKIPEINGKQYQEGAQSGFWNLREYVLHRDNHTCQNPDCKNKSRHPVLEVHHMGYWKLDRSDRPGNLITLCNKCHTPAGHKKNGFLYGWEPKTKSFKPETFMSTVRWKLVNALECDHTYGHMWDLHPLGNIIEFHPLVRLNPNDSDLTGHEQRRLCFYFTDHVMYDFSSNSP